jgi:hypothetical protein
MRARPGWAAWLASMAGDARMSAVSRLLDDAVPGAAPSEDPRLDSLA